MDIAILILRVVLGCLVAAHGLQKARGWFSGPGLAATSGAFEAWGFRPGKPMVVLAAFCEITGGLLLALGLATPLACAILIATLIVAMSPNIGKGFWAAAGGIELPFAYATIAVALAFSGAGAFSLDALIGIPHGPVVGIIALAVGVLGAVPPLLARHRVLAGASGSTV